MLHNHESGVQQQQVCEPCCPISGNTINTVFGSPENVGRCRMDPSCEKLKHATLVKLAVVVAFRLHPQSNDAAGVECKLHLFWQSVAVSALNGPLCAPGWTSEQPLIRSSVLASKIDSQRLIHRQPPFLRHSLTSLPHT